MNKIRFIIDILRGIQRLNENDAEMVPGTQTGEPHTGLVNGKASPLRLQSAMSGLFSYMKGFGR
jgi:hypothetical protein